MVLTYQLVFLEPLVAVGVAAVYVIIYFFGSLFFSSLTDLIIRILLGFNRDIFKIIPKSLTDVKIILMVKILIFWIEKFIYGYLIFFAALFIIMILDDPIMQNLIDMLLMWFAINRILYYISYHARNHLEVLKSNPRMGIVIGLKGIKGRICEISTEFFLMNPIKIKLLDMSVYKDNQNEQILVKQLRIHEKEDVLVEQNNKGIQKWIVQKSNQHYKVPIDDLIHNIITYYNY